MCRLVVSNELTLTLLGPAGADPGFPVGGGANPPGGRQHMILPNIAKNCMKLRTFWAPWGAPPKSATAQYYFYSQIIFPSS